MKLVDLKPSAGKFYPKDPRTGDSITLEDGTEVFWHVVGNDSSEHLDAQKKFLKDLEDMAEEDKESLDKFDYLEFAQKNTAYLVKGWDKEFDDSMGGEYTHEYVEQLLTNPDYKWLYVQLDAFVSSRRNFFPN
jgi:hypothetical protein